MEIGSEKKRGCFFHCRSFLSQVVTDVTAEMVSLEPEAFRDQKVSRKICNERWRVRELTPHILNIIPLELYLDVIPSPSTDNVEGCPILRQIYAWHCIVLYPPNNRLTIQYNREWSNTIECNTMPCINLSEYWTILIMLPRALRGCFCGRWQCMDWLFIDSCGTFKTRKSVYVINSLIFTGDRVVVGVVIRNV